MSKSHCERVKSAMDRFCVQLGRNLASFETSLVFFGIFQRISKF